MESGMVYFHPDSVSVNDFVPKVVFTQLIYYFKTPIGLEATEIFGISTKKNISLSHKENTFTISFAGLSYDNPTMNQ